MERKRKINRKTFAAIRNFLEYAAMIGIFLVFMSIAFPNLFSVIRSGDLSRIEDYLQARSGPVTALFLGIMQFVQLLTIVLPGLAIRMASGALLGSIRGTLTCYISYLLAHTAVFSLSRKLHYQPEEADEELENIEKKKGFARTLVQKVLRGNDPLVWMVIIAIAPTFPKGVIPYVGARTSLSFKEFLLADAAGSLLPFFIDCTAGSLAISGNFAGTLLIFAPLWIITGLIYWKQDSVSAVAARLFRRTGDKEG